MCIRLHMGTRGFGIAPRVLCSAGRGLDGGARVAALAEFLGGDGGEVGAGGGFGWGGGGGGPGA